MKNILFKAAIALLVIATNIACVNNDDATEKAAAYRSAFINTSDVNASVKGVVVKDFDQTTDQISYSDSKSSFMISNGDCSTYYALSLSGTFIVDYKVSVICTTAGIDGLESKTYETTVVKLDNDSKTYWLWDSSSNTGFVVSFTL